MQRREKNVYKKLSQSHSPNNELNSESLKLKQTYFRFHYALLTKVYAADDDILYDDECRRSNLFYRKCRMERRTEFTFVVGFAFGLVGLKILFQAMTRHVRLRPPPPHHRIIKKTIAIASLLI